MRRRALGLALAALPLSGQAQCGPAVRALLNPLARITRLEHEQPVGALPALMRELARRSGCAVSIQVVPRARLMAMFQGGDGDLVIAGRNRAVHTLGSFVPLLRLRPQIVFERAQADAVPADAQTLLERSSWRGLYVRGAGMSDEVLTLWQGLEAQRRVNLVRDWATVLRMLLAQRAEFTLFSPTLLHGETALMSGEARERLQARPLPGLPAYEIGALLSPGLPAAQRESLRQHLDTIARDGTLRRLLLQEHPAELIEQDFQFL